MDDYFFDEKICINNNNSNNNNNRNKYNENNDVMNSNIIENKIMNSTSMKISNQATKSENLENIMNTDSERSRPPVVIKLDFPTQINSNFTISLFQRN